jgi:hypothetical protein
MTGKSPYAIPTARNAMIVLAQLGGIAVAVCFVRVAHQWWELALLALAFGILMNSVYSIIHEAEHGILFPNRRVNDAVGIFLAAFFPAPFHLIRQGHLGHHLRNRSDDEAFDLYFGFTWSAMQYVHHYGTERDVIKGARNLFVWGPLDRIWLNQLAPDASRPSHGAVGLSAEVGNAGGPPARVPSLGISADVARAAEDQRTCGEPVCGADHPIVPAVMRFDDLGWRDCHNVMFADVKATDVLQAGRRS